MFTDGAAGGFTSLGSIQSEADIIARLPSKQSSLQRSRSTIERARPTTLKSRKDNKSVKSIHPPSATTLRSDTSAPPGESIELDVVDLDVDVDGGEDFVDEDENWRRLQQIKSMTSSLDTKRQARSVVNPLQLGSQDFPSHYGQIFLL